MLAEISTLKRNNYAKIPSNTFHYRLFTKILLFTLYLPVSAIILQQTPEFITVIKIMGRVGSVGSIVKRAIISAQNLF